MPETVDGKSEGRDIAESIDELCATGERLLEIGKTDEAEATWRQVVQLQPHSAYAHNKLGVCLARQGRLEEARSCFTDALQLDPKFAPAHSNIGNLHREADRLDDAINSYLEALHHDPDYHVAHHNLGAAYRQQGRISEAVTHLKRAHRLERTAHREEARHRRSAMSPSWGRIALWVAVAVVAYLVFIR